MIIILSALIPAIFLGMLFFLFDNNKEPFSIVVKSFLLGIGAVFLVLIANFFLHAPDNDGTFYISLSVAFIYAGFIEEAAKFVVFFFFLYKHKEFDEWYDGLLYGVLIGLGFAFIENILYFVALFSKSGFSIIISRSLFSMPAHALFGAVMGYFIGKYKFKSRSNKLLLVQAFIWPFLLHGIYDFVLMYTKLNLSWIILPLMIYLWIKVLKLRRLSQK